MFDNDLSSQLDQAIAMEDYCRQLLLQWKQRRQELEARIPLDDPIGDFLQELDDGDNDNVISD